MTGPRIWMAAGVVVALACEFEQPKDYTPEEVIELHICGVNDDKCGESAEDDAVSITANGVDKLRLKVTFPTESAPGKELTLTTTLGVLDAGASGAAQLTKTLKTSDISPVTTLFSAGTESGEALIRATIGTATVERALTIDPAPPTALDLLASQYVLSVSAPSSDLSVYLYNEAAPLATVSNGIDVQLRTCSVDDVDAADSKMNPKVDVLKVVRAGDPKAGMVTTKLSLNALGAGLVNEVGGEQALQVHAYVVADGEATPEIPEASTCATIDRELADIAAHDMITLILRRKAM